MSRTKNQGTVLVSAEDLRGMHHGEIISFTRDVDGPGASGVYYNSLGLDDDITDEEYDARFRALDPEELKTDFG